MNQEPRKPDGLERDLLAHFRAHDAGEPSAELDARILAAARDAVRPARPGLGERLHAWLFGPGGRQRWSVAFAGLACLGIGVSLTWRNLDRPELDYESGIPAPAAMRAPAPIVPVAPAAAPMARASEATAVAGSMESAPEPDVAGYAAPAPEPRMEREAKKMAASRLAEEAQRQAPVAALSDQADVHEQAAEALKAEATALAAKPRPAPAKAKEETLVAQLEELLALREKRDTQAADALLARLRQDHPQLDIEAELERLGERR
ncbi:hypothetical protein TUM18999_18900 [Pseudomonas tohonis]|uniref:Uncharacterized protein n=1 Tax=Pseudomonas tohonis TaxID=2725477 RepID=A0A6J4E2X1_9PSED|nr:hypothetical protein [Pseudomonas tohonis]BCG23699.1 hypothetical protein TUM18999_18900 [Pseudomonas tohonis]GJN51743.1 hypothetical protein TUM20286_14950 [Pseudomonas tohonis]